MFLESLLLGAYMVSGLVALAAYASQIRRYWRDAQARRGICPLAWSLWSVCALIDFLYVAAIVGDIPLMVFAGANAAACLSILGLARVR